MQRLPKDRGADAAKRTGVVDSKLGVRFVNRARHPTILMRPKRLRYRRQHSGQARNLDSYNSSYNGK